MTVSEFTLYRLEDGKFAEVWDLTDMDAVMRQIAVTTKATTAAAARRMFGVLMVVPLLVCFGLGIR